MFGYRIHEWGATPVWEELPEPVPGPGEVALDVAACGVGLTVLNCIDGNLDDGRATLPRVPGHELVGTVSAIGPEVPSELAGRRVVGYFYLFCGECAACLAGKEQRCARLAGWVGVHRNGGYAPRVVLPARNVIPVPEDLDPVAATVVPDAVATPVHVAARAQIDESDRVVVVGAGGGVGIHMVQVAAHHGAAVAGFDVGPDKLAAIERLDALAVDSSDFSSVDADRLFSGGPPTVVVDLIGTDASTMWGLDALGMGGRLVALTTFPGRPQTFESRNLVFRESALVGSRYATRAQVAEAGALVAAGDIAPIIGSVCGPGDVLGLHDLLRSGELIGRGALDWTKA